MKTARPSPRSGSALPQPRRPLPILALAGALLLTSALAAQVNILTNRYDGARVGANLAETVLTAANVNATRFGRLFSYPVDGSVYAQPLYVQGVVINGTPRNVLYVATMNDKVYAFDADSSSPVPLWMRNFTNPPSVTPVPITDIAGANLNIVGNVGIQSTPVIDAARGTIYLVARTKENGAYLQRLHALDIATGAARAGSPVTITASVAGTGSDSVHGASGRVVIFNPRMQGQRAGLALANGVVLIAWAGHEDLPPYHGWVMGYDAATLAQVAAFCVTPDASAGGIWQGGRAPTIDAAGNAYFVTGNGEWDGTRDFGNSVLKFAVSRTGLSLVDYFTPSNQATLTANDDDLSGSSFTLLPGTNLMLGGGKEGVLYLLNSDNLGRMAANDAQIVQRIGVSGGHVMGGPVFWNSASLGRLIYNWSEDDVLKAYRFTSGRLALPPFAQGNVASPGHPGGSLTLSANGSTAGSGIVWASMPTSQDGRHGLVAGVLRAFDAETLNEIWSSERNPARDRVGSLMKFVPPVVVNGRVYLANHDNAVAVYGLLGPSPPASAGSIAIDFVGGSATVMAAAETAGVVSQAHWNSAPGASRTTPLPLVDGSGAATGASVTWSAPGGVWTVPIVDQPGNARMMRGYLDTDNTTSTSVTVAGLPSRAYDIYVYADGDNSSYDRSAAYTISGAGIATATVALMDAANVNFASTFGQANGSTGNYVRFRINGDGFTLTAVPTTPQEGTRRAAVNGLQIVPVAPSADFTVAATPASRTATAGGSVGYTVTVGAVNGFTGQVALGVAGAPAGSTAAFNPSTIGGAGTSTLTVSIPASAPAGTSTLTISGTSGSLRHSVSVTLTVAPTAARSGAIGIDFVGASLVSMGPGETAGVVPQAHWNSAAGATQSTPLALVDDSGAASGASVTWSAGGGGWMTPIADQPGNARMMKGYLDTTSASSTTVTVSGLPQATYDVFVYADGDNRAYDRSASYTIGGSGITAAAIALTDPANTNFAGTFVAANQTSGNYVRFRITGTGFTVTASPTLPEAGTRRAAVNGIQIVPVAAPTAGAIGIDFTGAGVTIGATEIAGVVPQPRWNAAAGAARSTPLALVDERGAATQATVTWSANGAWTVPIADQPGNARLMRGYLDSSSTSVTTVSVAGLRSGAYDVYVYADGDNRTFDRSASYRISGAGIAAAVIALTDPAGVNFSGSFTQADAGAGNYVKFRINASGFTLTATPASASGSMRRAPVNAVQIVPVR